MFRKLGRKGQGAMEYLMTYGWAILVVMIVGIVMWQLGIFNMGGTTVTATGFSKLKPQLAGTGFAADGTPKMIFTNGVGSRITILSARVIDQIAKGSSCGISSAAFKPNNMPSAGDNVKVSSAALGACLNNGKAGEVYNAQVRINYKVTIGGIETSHTETGSIRGPFE